MLDFLDRIVCFLTQFILSNYGYLSDVDIGSMMNVSSMSPSSLIMDSSLTGCFYYSTIPLDVAVLSNYG